MRKALLAAVATVALAAAPGASAATLIVDGNGILTGATGVNVGGSLYDVSFVDGTCVALFSGCDQSADFTFQTSSSATAAGSALLNQVFLNGAQGSFDTQPSLTFGCGNAGVCNALIPYGFFTSALQTTITANFNFDSLDRVYTSQTSTSVDTGPFNDVVFAQFTITAVPEPSTWAMMLVGFGAIGFSVRRARRVKAVLQVA